MSKCNRSLAVEEINQPVEECVDLLPLRYLSLSNASTDIQPVNQVVKVSGNITISF